MTTKLMGKLSLILLNKLMYEFRRESTYFKKKNFKELLKKYNKTKTEYLNSLNIIKNKIDDKSIHFSLLQNNLKIKSEFIEKLESKKLY